MRRGFTLIELLVVIVIVVIVSAVALPTILSALSHRQVGEAARILQANLAGARDAAVRDNAPSGIRLLPDPNFTGINPATGKLDGSLPLAYNRMIPIQVAPNYSEGLITAWPQGSLPKAVGALAYPVSSTAAPNPTYAQTTCLMAYESSGTMTNGVFTPNTPTAWSWNIRVGDKMQIGSSGKWYTVIGPMVVSPTGAGANQGNPELFVNVGPPGTVSPLLDSFGNAVDFLLLVNGLDDNKNGFIDEGWDGVDNDGVNGVDDIGEWIETEGW